MLRRGDGRRPARPHTYHAPPSAAHGMTCARLRCIAVGDEVREPMNARLRINHALERIERSVAGDFSMTFLEVRRCIVVVWDGSQQTAS